MKTGRRRAMNGRGGANGGAQVAAAAAQLPVVRRRRPGQAGCGRSATGPGCASSVTRAKTTSAAGHRDPEHLVRHQPLPHAPAGAGRARQAGGLAGGGFPLEFPVSTLSETFQKPTPMLYRNLLAMEAEELLRSYPSTARCSWAGATGPPRVAHGRGHGAPGIFIAGGTVLRQLPRPPRHRYRPVEVLGRLPGRADRRVRADRARERDRPLARVLHDHGYRSTMTSAPRRWA